MSELSIQIIKQQLNPFIYFTIIYLSLNLNSNKIRLYLRIIYLNSKHTNNRDRQKTTSEISKTQKKLKDCNLYIVQDCFCKKI